MKYNKNIYVYLHHDHLYPSIMMIATGLNNYTLFISCAATENQPKLNLCADMENLFLVGKKCICLQPMLPAVDILYKWWRIIYVQILNMLNSKYLSNSCEPVSESKKMTAHNYFLTFKFLNV